MELNTNDISSYKNISGADEFELAAGKTLKIETSPDGDEILEITVPRGKKHNVKIEITIIETDE